MSCTIAKRDFEGVVICDIKGRMSFPDPHIHNFINPSLDCGSRRFVLNLAGVSYMDSFGMHDLVLARNAITAAQGKLVLLNPSPRVRKVLEITMRDIFAIFEDETAAVNAVQA